MIRQRSKSTILKRCRKFSANREAPGYRLHHRQPGVSYSAIPSFLILASISSMCLPIFSGSLSRSFFREHCDGKVPVMNELKAEKEKLLTLQSEQRKELSAMLLCFLFRQRRASASAAFCIPCQHGRRSRLFFPEDIQISFKQFSPLFRITLHTFSSFPTRLNAHTRYSVSHPNDSAPESRPSMIKFVSCRYG